MSPSTNAIPIHWSSTGPQASWDKSGGATSSESSASPIAFIYQFVTRFGLDELAGGTM